MFHRKKSRNIAIGLGVWLAIPLLTIFIGSPIILDTVYAQEDTKAIGAVQLESNQPGVLEVSWDAPTETPRDYRVNWARVGENFPTWTDLSGNAFPTSSSYTITDLDQGVRYKVQVRARYDGSAGDWSERVEAVVASAPTATATATATDTPTPTATPTPIPADTATPTAIATATSTPPPAQQPPPQNLQAAATHNSVTLTWDDPGDSSMTGYQILRRNRDVDAVGEFTIIVDDTANAATRYVDNTVLAESRYGYRIRARNVSDLSQRSMYANADTPSEPTPTPIPTATPTATPTPIPADTATPTAIATATSTPPPAQPPPPQNLQAAATHNSVTLTWDDPGDSSITGYQILRRNRDVDAVGEFTIIVDDTANAATRYVDNTVLAESHYGYRIKARNVSGLSRRSMHANADTPSEPTPTPIPTATPTATHTPIPADTATPTAIATATSTLTPAPPPPPPQNLQAAATHNSVTLTWDDPGDSSITGYQILRRNRDVDAVGEFTIIVDDTGNAATRYVDNTVLAESRYGYRIKARNVSGLSQISMYANADTPSEPTPTPTPTVTPTRNSRAIVAIGIVRPLNSSSPAQVSWSVPTETPVDYHINWAPADESYPTGAANNAYPTGRSYTITGLEDVRHKMRVRARYNGSFGPWKETVFGVHSEITSTPTATPTPVPTATPTPTATSTPMATATPTPTATAPTPTVTPTRNNRTIVAIGIVRPLNSSSPAQVSWSVPTETPVDYHINWAPADESYPTGAANNAYPTGRSYTITGLEDVRHKMRVRARYNGSFGPWKETVFGVHSEITSTATTTPTPTATSTPIPTEESSNGFTSGGSGTADDPYIISDPTSVSAHSIHSYVAGLQNRHSVYFQWNTKNHSGTWTIRIDASPTEHDFDLFGRDDQGINWDDSDQSYDGDENITVTAQSGGHIYIRVRNYRGGAPTDLTLTIEPPGGG